MKTKTNLVASYQNIPASGLTQLIDDLLRYRPHLVIDAQMTIYNTFDVEVYEKVKK